MLEKFRKAQEPAVTRLAGLAAKGGMPAPYAGARPVFSEQLLLGAPGAVIAEYKRASPSLGAINLEAGPEEVAAMYATSGASALSVLTEEAYFKGSIDFLFRMADPGLALLRKDFLIHPLQVMETASTPASALLLIARMLEDSLLAAMLGETYQAGMEAVLEVFDDDDLKKARQALEKVRVTRPVIQVNNRDLQKLSTSDEPSRVLIRHKREGEIWISASGIHSRKQVEERAALGFDAVLVGGSLMGHGNPGQALAELTGKLPRPDQGKAGVA